MSHLSVVGSRTQVTPFARFDDFACDRALVLREPVGILQALRPEEVAGLLCRVERAVSDGAWAAGFVTYEAAPGLDPSLTVRRPAPGRPFCDLPLAWFALFARAEHSKPVAPPAAGGSSPARWRPETSDADYEAAVGRIRDRIAAGETYQCNLTTRLRAQVGGDPSDLYASLASGQQGAHCARLDTGRFAVLCASPELFFEWRGDRVTTRPMKGTAPRGRFEAEDEAFSKALLTSEKERAENLMIVDLVRSDLGRIAEWGSVTVDSLFTREQFPTVWQLTSSVSASARPGTGLVDLFRALFPAGSVTGAPKRRTMELIAELEPSPRGVYCGAVGFVAPPGTEVNARFSVPIRTVLVDRRSGEAEYGTGGGITWSSDPAAEREELWAKARILDRQESYDLVETMAFVPGRGVRNEERHLARLRFSAGRLGFRFDRTAIRDAIEGAASRLVEPSRLRLTLSRAGAITTDTSGLPSAGPVRLAVDDEPVDSADLLLFHKTTRRDPYVARAARHPGVDDVVLVNERGRPTETTIANLLVEIGGRWWTPPVDAGCLPGVERGRLIDEGLVAERDLTIEDLGRADRLAVVSSLRGRRAATLVTPAAALRGPRRPSAAQALAHEPVVALPDPASGRNQG